MRAHVHARTRIFVWLTDKKTYTQTHTHEA